MGSPNLDPILPGMHARQHQVYKGLLLCSLDAPAGESASDLRDHAPAAPYELGGLVARRAARALRRGP